VGMTHKARILTILLALVLGRNATSVEATSPHLSAETIAEQEIMSPEVMRQAPSALPKPREHGEIRRHGLSPELSDAVDEAVALFGLSGLWLPDLDIHSHVDKAECSQASGVFNLDGSGSRIDMCTDRVCVVIHEVAHAWVHHNVSTATRERFSALVGATLWNPHSGQWHERPVELAAEAIGWGLPTDPLPSVYVDRSKELQSRFEMITGKTSPRLANTDPTGVASASGQREIADSVVGTDPAPQAPTGFRSTCAPITVVPARIAELRARTNRG
jgi:hypothetical protein